MTNTPKNIILFLCLISLPQFLYPQDIIIKPESSDNFLSMLKDSKVESIRIITTDEELLNIEVRCKSIEDGKNEIVVSGIIMDNRKKNIKAIICNPETISKGSSSVDLSFKISNIGEGNAPFVNSGYIKVIVSENEKDADGESILDDLSSLFGNESETGLEGLTAESYLFKYNKEWRVPGNKDMIITISFQPIGKAVNAKM